MANDASVHEDPIIVVRLLEGLADRHRLPLNHVISVLEEIRQMVTEAGRAIRNENGDDSAPDFGLELVAGEDGVVFKEGSVQASIAITTNVQEGFLAAQKIVKTVELLRVKNPTKGDSNVDYSIVRRLGRIARIQRTDKTRLALSVRRPMENHRDYSTVFDQTAVDSVRSLQAATFTIEDMTLNGKLTQLRDKDYEEDSRRGFWGELARENGESWRVQFKMSDVGTVSQLFRKQVSITGKAYYFRAQSPKLVAERIVVEQERDYEKAFDDLFGCDKELFNSDFASLLNELRGE